MPCGVGGAAESRRPSSTSTALLQLVDDSELSGGVLDAERAMITRRFAIVNHALLGDTTMARALEAMRALAASTPDGAHVASVCGFACNVAALAGRWDDLEDFVQMGLAADPSSQFAFWGGHLLMSGAIAGRASRRRRRGHSLVHRGPRSLRRRGRNVGVGGARRTAGHGVCRARPPRRGDSVGARCARAGLDTRHERWTESIVLSAEAVVAHAAGGRGDSPRASRHCGVGRDRAGRARVAARVREIASGIAVSLDA